MCSHEVRKEWPIIRPGTFILKMTIKDALEVAAPTPPMVVPPESITDSGASASGLEAPIVPSRHLIPEPASASATPVQGPAAAPAPALAAASPPAPAAAPAPAPATGLVWNLPHKLVDAHADDKIELLKVVTETTQRNLGRVLNTETSRATSSGTGSRLELTDLLQVNLNEAAMHDVVDPDATRWEDHSDEGEALPEDATWKTLTGVSDHRYGDGRAPTEANWRGIDELSESVGQAAISVLMRRRPRSTSEVPLG